MPPLAENTLERVRTILSSSFGDVREIGRGGMAVVFAADDRKHDRRIALKLLRPDVACHTTAQRFLREIKLAARLTHPSILPVLDSGVCEELPYYVMPFVVGESLAERLERDRALPIATATAIVKQVADALDYAHAAGIVHRDIKPGNILLVGDHALIADFGIARAMDATVGGETLTTAGTALGTPAYMSPEQAAGDSDIGPASDVYSLAIVAFEMLSGALPFKGKTAHATIAMRLMNDAPRLRAFWADAPRYVDDALAAALQREPDDRPSSAVAFARMLSGESPALADVGSRAQAASPFTMGGTMRADVVTDPGTPSVGVLPFANVGGAADAEFFCDGLTEEIIGALGRLRTLRVAGRGSSFALKGHSLDARVAAKQLGVSTILDGSVRRAGQRVHVTTQLIDAGSGLDIWSDIFDRQLDDISALQSEIAEAIATALGRSLVLPAAQPVPGDVYERFLRARYALSQRTESGLRDAARQFAQVIGMKSDFAPAWAALAQSQLLLALYGVDRPRTVMPRARHAAENALRLDPTLPDAHSTLASVEAVFDWNWQPSGEAFRRALTLDPQSAPVHQRYALDYLVPRGRYEEATAVIDRARTLDPLSLAIQASAGVVKYLCGDLAGAVDELRRVTAVYPDFAMGHYFLASVLRDTGDLAAARTEIEQATRLSQSPSAEMLSARAQIAARSPGSSGMATRRDEAMRDLSAIRALENADRSLAALTAQVYLSLGDNASALDALERAVTEREAEVIYLASRPVYHPLRGDTRFETLLTTIGLTPRAA